MHRCRYRCIKRIATFAKPIELNHGHHTSEPPRTNPRTRSVSGNSVGGATACSPWGLCLASSSASSTGLPPRLCGSE